MGRVEERLASLGIEIPDAPPPAGEYVGVRRSGALAFVSGQIASGVGGASPSGRVGVDVTVDAARSLCRAAMLNCLGQLKAELGSLDRVRRVVKVTGYVRSAPDFGGQPEVVNGASQLLIEIFGEDGRHARAAVGVAELPRRAPVEVELVVEVVTNDA